MSETEAMDSRIPIADKGKSSWAAKGMCQFM